MINGDRVRQARELCAFTQTELAERLHVEQPTIARIENGTLKPSQGLIEALALQTGFPPEFFSQPSAPDFPLGSLLFRAHASTTLREKSEAYRYAQVIYEMADVLSARLTPVTLRLPQLAEPPPRAASLTRALLGLSPDTPIPNLLKAVENAGVLVLALPIALEGRDAFSLWAGDNKRPVIFLSADRPADRIRFNIAHELGHLVLHPTIRGQIAAVEKEADQFAAEFLMPEIAIRRDLVAPLALAMIAKLKPRWRVSIQALTRRAFDLGIISKGQYGYLFAQIGARGWRTQEPPNLDFPMEKPRALRKMAEVLYGAPISYQKLASDVKLSTAFVRAVLDAHAERSEFGVGALPSGRRLGNVVQLRRP